jgi:hypothetical protein
MPTTTAGIGLNPHHGRQLMIGLNPHHRRQLTMPPKSTRLSMRPITRLDGDADKFQAEIHASHSRYKGHERQYRLEMLRIGRLLNAAKLALNPDDTRVIPFGAWMDWLEQFPFSYPTASTYMLVAKTAGNDKAKIMTVIDLGEQKFLKKYNGHGASDYNDEATFTDANFAEAIELYDLERANLPPALIERLVEARGPVAQLISDRRWHDHLKALQPTEPRPVRTFLDSGAYTDFTKPKSKSFRH